MSPQKLTMHLLNTYQYQVGHMLVGHQARTLHLVGRLYYLSTKIHSYQN